MRTLFCIPGGGASSVMYLGWKKKLEGAFEVVPLEIPGRGRAAGAAQLETVEEVSEVLAAEIRRTAGDREFALFGYCYGGVIAYEVCRRLAAGGFRAPEEVFLCGAAAPNDREGVKPLLSQKDKRPALKTMLSRFFPSYLVSNRGRLEELCVRYMDALFRKYDEEGRIVPVQAEDLGAEKDGEAEDRVFAYILSFANAFFENYGRDEASLIRYCEEDKEAFLLDGRVTVICGRDDDITGRGGGLWQSCCARPVDLVYIDGDHFSLIEDIDVIASIVTKTAADPVREGLLSIWRKVLNEGEDFTVEDDTSFFDIGGNSLLLGIMNVLIEKNLGKKLNVELLFENQAFGAMAAAIGNS